jgi:hypothetical protein
METKQTAQAIRQGKKIIGYIYRGVQIARVEGGFEFTLDRYTRTTIEVFARTLADITARVDKSLAEGGRTTNGKLVVPTVVDGVIVTALANSDWHYPNARLV